MFTNCDNIVAVEVHVVMKPCYDTTEDWLNGDKLHSVIVDYGLVVAWVHICALEIQLRTTLLRPSMVLWSVSGHIDRLSVTDASWHHSLYPNMAHWLWCCDQLPKPHTTKHTIETSPYIFCWHSDENRTWLTESVYLAFVDGRVLYLCG